MSGRTDRHSRDGVLNPCTDVPRTSREQVGPRHHHSQQGRGDIPPSTTRTGAATTTTATAGSRTCRTTRKGLAFDYVHSAVDDHTRLAYSEADEKDATCADFLRRAAVFFTTPRHHQDRTRADRPCLVLPQEPRLASDPGRTRHHGQTHPPLPTTGFGMSLCEQVCLRLPGWRPHGLIAASPQTTDASTRIPWAHAPERCGHRRPE